ncbi:MAG: WcbI family polysaccharide biosynthesis putative acetyltransferase [Candidatus Acidiferrum sp.]
MSLPAVLFYGNCQAHLLCACFRSVPGVEKTYQAERFLDFVYPGSNRMEVPPEELLERCEVLIIQMGAKRADPEYVARLAAHGTQIIRFPTTICLPLWPQECPDRRNYAENKYPFGRYPYGDRVLLELMDQGKSEEVIVEEYFATDVASLFSVDRVMEYWRHTLSALDARSDIKAGAFIEKEFRAKRLFHTRNHPSVELTNFLLEEIMRRAWGDGTPRSHIRFAASVPMDQYMTPIHPSVANALELKWCGEETLHRHYDNGWFTHREFARRYVRYEG